MFNPGNPIQDFSQDDLRRERYARKLADALLSYTDESSLIVGLDGSWGTGKTSILNLVIQAMGERSWAQSPIVIVFNPWYFSNQDNLLHQFFQAFSQRFEQPDLQKNYDRAADKIELFAESLEAVADDVPLGFIAKLVAAASRYKSKRKRREAAEARTLDSLKRQISTLLTAGQRRIIVFIDDVDRLTKVEIRLVFRLVKAVADFKFVTYVLAFDEDIVKDALREVGGEEFLDKIINVPLNVPAVTSIQVQRLVFKRLNQFAESHPEYQWTNDRVIEVAQFVTGTFKTIRHMGRLINTLNFTTSTLHGEVDYADLIAILALRSTAPGVYNFIRNNRVYFLDTPERHINRERADNEAKEAFESLLSQHKGIREALPELLAVIFPRFDEIMNRRTGRRGDEHSWNRERRICSPKSFDAYFTFDVPEGDVSSERVRQILDSLSEQSFDAAFRELMSEGTDSVLAFLERLADDVDSTEVQKGARAIVKVLLNSGDAFPSDIGGFPFKLDGRTLIMQLVFQILRRNPDERERFDILKDAVSSADESLQSPVTQISVEDQAHRRYDDSNRARDPSREHELVSDEHLDELEKVACGKIEEWATDGRLAPHPSLPYLLFRWRNWDAPDRVSRYVLDELDAANFVRLVVLMARDQAKKNLGSAPSLKNSPIAKLADVSAIRARLRDILSGEFRGTVNGDYLTDATTVDSEETQESPEE